MTKSAVRSRFLPFIAAVSLYSAQQGSTGGPLMHPARGRLYRKSFYPLCALAELWPAGGINTGKLFRLSYVYSLPFLRAGALCCPPKGRSASVFFAAGQR